MEREELEALNEWLESHADLLRSKVRKEPGGCWIWTGVRTKGYGVQRVTKLPALRRMLEVHRISFYLNNPGGFPTRDPEVRHKCDVAGCCNPDHLELGTHAQNQNDMAVRGRSAKGERNGSAELFEAEVRLMREVFAQGWTRREIAECFGISRAQVNRILNGEAWSHIEMPDGWENVDMSADSRAGAKNGRAKLSEDVVRNVRRAVAIDGWSYSRCARALAVSSVTIKKAVTGETWGELPHEEGTEHVRTV